MRAGALEGRGQSMALSPAHLAAQQLLPAGALNAIEEEARALVTAAEIRDLLRESLDVHLQPDRGVGAQAKLPEPEPERPLDLIDLLGELPLGIVGGQ